MDAIKTNYEGLVGTLHKSFAKVAEDMQEIRDLIARVIAHTNDKLQSMDDKIQSMDSRIQSLHDTMDGRIQSLHDTMHDRIQSTRDDLQKSFRDDLRDFRRDVKEDVRDSFNGFRWTIGIIVALAVAVLKLFP